MARFVVLVLVLMLAAVGVVAQDEAVEETAAGEPVVHVVTYGDTLFRIAQRYGVTVDDIARENNIAYTWSIQLGQRLTIPGLTLPTEPGSVDNPLVAGTPVDHVVRPGETLNTIARRYGVTIEAILRGNQIGNPNLIMTGQTLKIWTPESTSAAETVADSVPETAEVVEDAAPETTTVEVPYTHIVRSGETLGTIARNYGVTVNQLISANVLPNPDRILVGAAIVIPGRSAVVTQGNTAAALADLTPPTPSVTVGKQVIVDLSEQRVYAFEDGEVVFTAIISSGLPATPTVLGDYKVYYRLESQTMSGPGYYLPGVQWVQYFYSGYAFHGTYWHDNFGQPMSHGCVNMRNEDAEWLFRWASIGTPVRVQT